MNEFSVGIIATMMVDYVGEIGPLKLRGILTCFIRVAYGIGPSSTTLELLNPDEHFAPSSAYNGALL